MIVEGAAMTLADDRGGGSTWSAARGEASAVVYRDGGPSDIDRVAQFVCAVRGGSQAQWVDLLRRAMSRPHAHLGLAEVDGAVVGYGRAGHADPVDATDPAPAGRYLGGLAVAPAWRRRGVATALVRRRLERIWGDGQPAWSFTNATNTASLALHARLGFVEVGRAGSYLGEPFTGGVGVLLRVAPPPP